LNGEDDSSLQVTIQPGPTVVTSIVPDSVSPVLKSILTITVANHSEPLNMNDLSVSLHSRDRPNIFRYINVIEVGETDNGDQYLKAKFGGSESGVYDVKVRSLTYGRFDSTNITLTLIGAVTDYNPKRGSVHGGTLVTITGYWFSNDPLDNPVRIGYDDCMVEESSATEIKCRTTGSWDMTD
jgi:hypothetical protein